VRHLRRFLRLIVFGILTPGAELLWLLGWIPARLLGRAEAWRGYIFSSWARLILRLFGVSLELRGPIPRGPGLVVSNHLSYLDVIVLASVMPCAFVAKREVRSWPILGALAATMGTIFVDRERNRDLLRVTTLLQERIAAGQMVVVFPEGTSSSGAEVLPFRPSLLDPFARLELPVRYAALRYETTGGDPPAANKVAWWGDMKFPSHFLGLLGLSRIKARLVFGEDGLVDPDRKRLAARLEEAVSRNFEPMNA
jgi:1-acyl-sn-glycerol-3-phosphate acyltransferase